MQWTISLPKMCNQAARMTGPRRRHPAWHLASQNTKALPKTLDTATFFDTTTSGTHICHQAPLILEVQTQKVIATTILVPLRRVSSTLRSTICQASRRERRWEFLTEQGSRFAERFVTENPWLGSVLLIFGGVFFLFFFSVPYFIIFLWGDPIYVYIYIIYFLGGMAWIYSWGVKSSGCCFLPASCWQKSWMFFFSERIPWNWCNFMIP